jgi:hypothetical protein
MERLAILGGGNELEENLKQELLRQARLRWRGPRSRGINQSHRREDGTRSDHAVMYSTGGVDQGGGLPNS